MTCYPQIFGVPIDKQPKTQNGIPLLIHKCIIFLDNKIDTEGIYRISGVKTRIEKLKLQFNQVRDSCKNLVDLSSLRFLGQILIMKFSHPVQVNQINKQSNLEQYNQKLAQSWIQDLVAVFFPAIFVCCWLINRMVKEYRI